MVNEDETTLFRKLVLVAVVAAEVAEVVAVLMRGILLFDFPSVSSVTLALINVVMFRVFILIRGIVVFVFVFVLDGAFNVLLIGIMFCNEMSLKSRLLDVRIFASFLRIISFTLSMLFNVFTSSLVVKQILFLIVDVVVVVADVVAVVVMGLLGDTYIDELK